MSWLGKFRTKTAVFFKKWPKFLTKYNKKNKNAKSNLNETSDDMKASQPLKLESKVNTCKWKLTKDSCKLYPTKDIVKVPVPSKCTSPGSKGMLPAIAMEITPKFVKINDKDKSENSMRKVLEGRYEIKEFLSKGGFGVVRLGVDIKTGEEVAIKCLEKKESLPYMFKIRSEIKFMQSIKHQHLCQFHGVFRSPDFLYLVMEYCPNGTLCSYIRKYKGLSDTETRRLFQQILTTIKFIHSQGYVHQDLKPENIMLDKHLNIKIIDFGLCAKPSPGMDAHLKEFCGTSGYMAPEVDKRLPYLGPPVDVYSCGIILYMMRFGSHPFKRRCFSEFNIPKSTPFQFVRLVKGMLEKCPEKRITIDEAMRNPWLKMYNSQTESNFSLSSIDSKMLAKGFSRSRSSGMNFNSTYFTLFDGYKCRDSSLGSQDSWKELNCLINKGTFGVVRLGMDNKTKNMVAIKCVIKKKSPVYMSNLRRETKALQDLKHRHLCQLYNVFETDHWVYFVMELCINGTLNNHVLLIGGLSENETRRLFRQILSVVKYIHSQGYVHRDLNPENILLDKNLNIKVIDFGLCAKPKDGLEGTLLDDVCETSAYMAPELIDCVPHLGEPADVYSCGAILYMMRYGSIPSLDNRIFIIPQNTSLHFVRLLKTLLHKKPEKRITINEALHHPWVTNLNAQLIKDMQGSYEVIKYLDSGGFGLVSLCMNTKIKQKFVIKCLNRDDSERHSSREIIALQSLYHQHMCPMYKVVKTEERFYIVMEYCSNGTLYDYIVENESLSEEESRRIFRQIISAVAYLHKSGYVHRDLMPENMMLDDDMNIKLIDFSNAMKPKGGLKNLINDYSGTPHYLAPEVLSNVPYFGAPADIWSCGVVLYTMLCFALPFTGENKDMILEEMLTQSITFPENISPHSKRFLTAILQVKPELRITMEELLAHPWVVKGYSKAVDWRGTSD